MKKANKSGKTRKVARTSKRGELRPHYDFDGGVRGKYAGRIAHGTNLVLLDPDVAAEFRNERAVNRVLREYLRQRAK